MTKRQNNIEFVTDLMDYSKSGALIQAFVITALEKYSLQVLADDTTWDTVFISQAAWKGCAQEVIGKLEARSK